MKGSFLVKASTLLFQNSIFEGAVSFTIGNTKYEEKGVLFLTPKGFNVRFLCGQTVKTVYLGNSFNNQSLKYYEEGFEKKVEGIFSFNFEISDQGRENFKFTEFFFPTNKISFYYESKLATYSYEVSIIVAQLNCIKKSFSNCFIFDSETVLRSVNPFCNWTGTVVSETRLKRGLNKINQALRVNTENFDKTNKILWDFF